MRAVEGMDLECWWLAPLMEVVGERKKNKRGTFEYYELHQAKMECIKEFSALERLGWIRALVP